MKTLPNFNSLETFSNVQSRSLTQTEARNFQPKHDMKFFVKMVYLEGICMAKADSHFVREQCNKETRKGPLPFVLLRLQQ